MPQAARAQRLCLPYANLIPFRGEVREGMALPGVLMEIQKPPIRHQPPRKRIEFGQVRPCDQRRSREGPQREFAALLPLRQLRGPRLAPCRMWTEPAVRQR